MRALLNTAAALLKTTWLQWMTAIAQKNKRTLMSSHLVIVASLAGPMAHADADNEVSLSDISWIDKKYFEKQRVIIDDLGRENYGTRIRGDISDLRVLQRIIDGQHIGIFDDNEQKALGITLGDIYVAEQGWHWQEYKDNQGRSRGVCIPDTTECVFPLSMMTRRMRVTTEIDIQKVYNRGLELMEDVMPQTPYEVKQEKLAEPDPLKGKKVTPFF